MTATGEDAEALRLAVVFLRNYSRMSQVELGRASGLRQGAISQLESGSRIPTEEVLRKLGAAAGIPWPLVKQLRSFYGAFLEAMPGEASPEPGRSSPAVAAEPESLALRSYWIEDAAASGYDEAAEAQATWRAISGLPEARRSRALEVSPRASRNGALAELLCDESERAAMRRPREALQLADLALRIAKQASGGEAKRSRLAGYAWAFKGNAYRVGGHLDRAAEAFLLGWKLWQGGRGARPCILAEWRLLVLEAALRKEEKRVPEAWDLIARAEREARGDAQILAAIRLRRDLLFRDTVGGA